MSAYRTNGRGVAAILASQLAFLLNDTLVKLTSEHLPLGEILCARGCFATLFIAVPVIALGLHRQVGQLFHRTVLARSIGELGGTFFYMLALFQMPLAAAMIIFQAVPLSVTAGAALFLREAVGWRRWTAIVVGFLGVLVVIRPGLASFNAAGLLVLVSVIFMSLRDLMSRALPATVPTLLMTLVTAASVAAMGAAIGLWEQWLWPTLTDVVRIAGASFLLSIGYFTAIAAMRQGSISVTAPFRYVAVVLAIAIGYLVWGDVPDVLMIIGSVIIVAAGLYTLYRERQAALAGGPLIAAPAAIDPPAAS